MPKQTVPSDTMYYLPPWYLRAWYRVLTVILGSHPHIPYADVPDGYADGVYVHTISRLSIIDRLRVLVTGVVHIESRTWVDKPIAKCETTSVFSVRT